MPIVGAVLIPLGYPLRSFAVILEVLCGPMWSFAVFSSTARHMILVMKPGLKCKSTKCESAKMLTSEVRNKNGKVTRILDAATFAFSKMRKSSCLFCKLIFLSPLSRNFANVPHF